jgi:hypothetical protein
VRRLDTNWLGAAGVLLFAIIGAVWAAYNTDGATSRIVAFALVGFVFSALLGVFVVVVLFLLVGGIRSLPVHARFARARRRGDSNVIEASTRRGDDSWERFIKKRLYGEPHDDEQASAE